MKYSFLVSGISKCPGPLVCVPAPEKFVMVVIRAVSTYMFVVVVHVIDCRDHSGSTFSYSLYMYGFSPPVTCCSMSSPRPTAT